MAFLFFTDHAEDFRGGIISHNPVRVTYAMVSLIHTS